LDLNCRNCGEVVDPRRVELGYDYCLKEECQLRCLKRVELAAIGVNKAADYYTTADELLPPRSMTKASVDRAELQEEAAQQEKQEEGESTEGAAKEKRLAREKRPVTDKARRPETTLERLRQKESDLDEALRRSYDHFQRGEITAREMEGECNALVESFNRQVMAENIRYRSLLRKRSRR
jgi:hypothetical protein